MRVPPSFLVDVDDAVVLREWASDPAQRALRRRALIVLLCADGHGPSAVALRLHCAKQTVITWRERYRAEGRDGLRDAPRSGRPTTVNPARVMLGTLQRPDPPEARWSTRSLGAELGISNVAVANVWREWGVRPEPGGRVSLRTEPVLDAPVLAVLGLHVDPPVYLCAVAVSDPRGVPTVTATPSLAPRPGLGSLLTDLLTSAEGVGSGDPAAGAGFRAELDHVRDHQLIHEAAASAPAAAGVRTALVAAGDTDPVRDRIDDRAAVALHTVAAVDSWERMVRVGCLLAGAAQDGAASVHALRAALADHRGGPFTWGLPRP